MSQLVLQVMSDLTYIFQQEPFNYLTATIVLACCVVILKRLIHI